MPRVFQPVPKTIEISVQGQLDGQLVENKFYAEAAGAVTSAMVNEMANIVSAWALAHLIPLLPPQYSYTRTVARDISVDSSFEVINPTGAGTVGTDSGNANPSNVTLAVHRSTGLSGKKAKSRIYWPAISRDELATENTVTSTFGGLVVTALNALLTAIEGGTTSTFQYGYPERVVNGVKLAIGIFVPVIAHTLTDFILDSQRDRLPGHGV